MNAKEWLNEISSAQKREKDFRKEGLNVLKIYEGSAGSESQKSAPFNILYSNTETLLPALYSTVPRPVVQRRFKDEDPLGKAASEAGKRVLEFLLDTNVEGYDTFDEGMKSAVLDGLLPGRGVTAIKYDAEIYNDIKASELVCPDTKQWNRVFFGYAKKWSRVPWIAYEEYIDEDEAAELFGDKAKTLEYIDEPKDDEDIDKDKKTDEEKRQVARIYQIWDKDSKKVIHISPQSKEILKQEDDPLGLTGFFNTPKPIAFLEKNDLNPVALYSLYENQAKELNDLTNRINRVVAAIQAKGIYDSSLGTDLAALMEGGDNTLVPADMASSLAADKGLGNAIWFMPIEQLVATLQQLYVAREACKQVIYEITGIADVIRGASKASETLGAQQIKEKWGGLRLKRLQKEVQRYARDLLRMMLEIASKKFSEKTFASMTGLPFLTQEQVKQLEAEVRQFQMQQQEPPPEFLEKIKAPKWADVLKMLRDDQQRAYRIDIETNSTVEPEAVEDQKNISDLMNALGQFLNGVGPLVAKGVLPFEVAKTMMMTISRRFRFGSEIEDQINQMQAPPPEEDPKAKEDEMKAQQEVMEANSRAANAEGQLKLAEREVQLATREAKVNALEENLKMMQQLIDEKFKASEQVLSAKQSSGDKVRVAQEQLFKKDAESAAEVDRMVSDSMNQMSKIIQQLAVMQAKTIESMAEQSLKNEEMMAQMIQIHMAPRRNIAVRGEDGRISETRSEVMQ